MSNFILNYLYEIAAVEVGQHFYWTLGNFEVHGQVLINSWIVFLIIFILALTTTQNMKLVPDSGQNFIESLTEFIRDISKTQIGEKEYLTWVPFLGTMFLFIFVSNWSGALVPWKIIELPSGELGAPTNDMCGLKLNFRISLLFFLKKFFYLKRFVNVLD